MPKKKNWKKRKKKPPVKRGCRIVVAIGVLVIIAILIAIGRAGRRSDDQAG